MNQKWKNFSLELFVGLFFITAMIILGFTSIILNQDLIKKNLVTYTVSFPEIGGLANGDRVLIQGVEVGRVKSIKLIDESVLVRFSVSPEVKIYPNYHIKIGSSSLLGGRNILINNGSNNSGSPLTHHTILNGKAPFDALEEIGAITTQIRDQEIINNLGEASRNLSAITKKINQGEGTLGELINNKFFFEQTQQTVDNLNHITSNLRQGKGTLGKLLTEEELHQDLQQALVNINSGAKEITLIAQDLRAGNGTLGKLLTDDTFYQEFSQTGANLNRITTSLANGEGSLGKFIHDKGAFYQDLSRLVANLQSTSENLNKGQGTLGKLINDSKLYDEATLGIQEFRRTVEDYREQSIWSSFGSFIFGAF